MTTVSRPTERSAMRVLHDLLGPSVTPRTAMIEIADRCNEVCVHCYQIQGRKGEMSTDEVRRVIDELADLGVLFLTFSGGEATLRSDFLELVEHARKRRFAVKLYTNGLTMTPSLAARLGELAVQEVQISLYSHRAEVHDWVTRVPGSFERTVQGIRNLQAARVQVLVKSPMMSVNAREYRDWLDFVKSLGVDYMIDATLDVREDGDRAPLALRPDDEQVRRLHMDPDFTGPVEATPVRDLERSPCGACAASIHVEANGEVRPCTLLDVPLGNALREGVSAAWKESPMAGAIRALTWMDHPGCRVCELQPYCGRCYANAVAESGDALGPYPSACARARLEYEVQHGLRLTVDVAADATSPATGPYRLRGIDRLEALPVERTAEDDALAERLPWTRRSPSPAILEADLATPGTLVQIRRPGKKPSLERVPAARPSGLPTEPG